MNFGGENGFLLEPGPAAFYLPAEESKTGVEEELFKFDLPSVMLSDSSILSSFDSAFSSANYDSSNEEPMDIQLSLDDFKAEGIDLNQLIKVNYDKNGIPFYTPFLDGSEENSEYHDRKSKAQGKQDGRLNFNDQNHSGSLLKPLDGTSKFKKRYTCSKCNGKVLVGLEKVLRHMLRNHCGLGSHKTRTYLCSLCDSVLSTESSLKKHIRNVHFRMEAFECPVCKKQIQQRSHLRRHIEKIHGGKKALKKVLKQARDLVNQNKTFFNEKHSSVNTNDSRNSLALIHSTKVNKFGGIEPSTVYTNDEKCHLCHRTYLSKETRDRHLVTFHRIGEKGESLVGTNKSGTQIDNKEKENDIGGLFDETQQCPTCGILCTSKAHLALHMKDRHHAGINQILNILKEADNESPQSIIKNNDLLLEDGKYRNSAALKKCSYVAKMCPICAKECLRGESITDHVSEVHKYLTRYKCNDCISVNKSIPEDQLFFSQAVLDAHGADFHNEEEIQNKDEYKCEHCKNAKFAIFHTTSSTEMLQHVLTCHAYGCAQCPKHFSTTGGLKYHYKKAHFSDFTAIDNTKHFKYEKHGNNKHIVHGSLSNINSDIENETERNKSSEFSVDTGDEAITALQHSSMASAATINSEDKSINPQILAQIRIDVSKIVDRIQSTGGDLKAIPCDFCRSTETHEDGASLLHHICTEHPYRCIYCPEKMVKLPTSMRKHFRKYHRDETPYFCRFCTAVFVCQGDANQHSLNYHSGEKSTLYRTTSSTVVSQSKVVSPELSKKNVAVDESGRGTTTPVCKENGSGVCIVCEQDFGDLRNLSDHVQETHNYICEVCNREYKLADSIRKHCRKDHSDYYEEPIVCCRFCPTVFHNIPAKQVHIASVHGIRMSGGKYLAPVNTPTVNESLMLSSVSPPATEESPSQGILSGENMLNNDTEGNFDSGPIYKCPHCPKGYDITDSLRKHAKNAHDVALGFCKDCQLVFPSHEEKTDHIKHVHTRIDNLAQDTPNIESSSTSPSQEVHSRQTSILTYLSPSLSTEKNIQITPSSNSNTPVIIGMAKSGYGEVNVEDAYQCPKCPKIYAIAKSLRKHCRKVHDELSICFCSTCTKVFISHEERDHHVSVGPCTELQNPNETIFSTATAETEGDTSISLEEAPHTRTRKRSMRTLTESDCLSHSEVHNVSSEELKSQHNNAHVNVSSPPVLTPLNTPSIKKIILQRNEICNSASNGPTQSKVTQSPFALTFVSNIAGKLGECRLKMTPAVSNSTINIVSPGAAQNSESSTISSHIQLGQQKLKFFQCDFCEAPAFTSKHLLEEHWLEYHPFGCTLCSKRYKLASSIRRHLHEAHNKKEVFVCHTCTLPFFSFGDKQKHLPECHQSLSKKVAIVNNGEKTLTTTIPSLTDTKDYTTESNNTEIVVDMKPRILLKQGNATRERIGVRASPRQRNCSNDLEKSSQHITIGEEGKNIISLNPGISNDNAYIKCVESKPNSLRNESNAEDGNITILGDTSTKTLLRQRSVSAKCGDISHGRTVDENNTGNKNNTGYTSTMPLSPLNFRGFRRPSSELEIVQGLGDFREGLNAYAAEYFIGNAVFDANMFEAAVVTDEIDGNQEETIWEEIEDSSRIVPAILEGVEEEDK